MSERRLTDVTLLARSPLLAGLPLTDIGTLLGVLDSDGVEQGASLATAGSPGDGLCFLLEGTAHAQDRSGRVVELAPGDHFGELTLLPEGRHDSNVTASTPLRVARLSPGSWATLTREHPDTALHLSLALLRRAAERLATAQSRAQLSPEPRRSVRSATITRAEGLCAEVLTGTRIADLVPEEVDGSLVVGARLDQLAVALHTPIVASASVEPLTTRSWEGRDIYRRTASIALLEAARRIGCSSLRLGPSITSGRVAHADEEDLPDLARRLERALAEVITENLPVREETWKVDEALAHFEEVGWHDAAALLALWHEPTVALVGCGEVLALDAGPMLPGTGMLRDLCVRTTSQGLVLDFGAVIRRELPEPPRSTVLLEARRPRYGADMTLQKRRWLELLGVTSIGHFGRACVSGRVDQLIHVSEGFHEKRIALIADEIRANEALRVVGIAGPSSSGKTTFIKRLKVQLEVNGIQPVELSLDDYYVDRERSPRGADGDYDFEALEALDRELLNHHVTRLLAGETVRTARFDFVTGKSAPNGGKELRLNPTSMLLVEGIHALNPQLLAAIPREQTFRIFIHPASALPYDRFSLFEPADVRLIRRIVRDRRHRGCSAADNLRRWPSVRRGERLHIFPFHEYADAVFDSSLVYEVSVLRVYAERYLLEVPRSHPEYSAAHRLLRQLRPFVPIHPDHVPPTSLLREFIGGSGFVY